MRLTPLLLCLALTPTLHADDLEKFARNDQLVGKGMYKPGDAAIEENILILTKAIADAPAGEVKAVLERFDALAKKNDDGYATSFGWVGGSKVVAGNLSIVCVNYGPVGYVRIMRGGRDLTTPESLQFTDQRAPDVLLAKGGAVVIASHFVRDAGIHDNTKVDFLKIDASNVRIEGTVKAEHLLDWGGAAVKGGRITIDSLDSPRSFFAYSEPYLKHRRTYTPDGKLVRDEPGDLALRAVDKWLLTAQHAKKPDALQKVAAGVLPGPELLSGITVKGARIDLTGDNGVLRFDLKATNGGYRVVSVRQVR